MADCYYSMCLIAAMDRLWFHQIILLSHDPISLIVPKILKKHEAISESLTSPSSTQSLSALPDEQISAALPSSVHQSPVTTLDDDLIKNGEGEDKEINMKFKRVTRLSHSSSRTRSLSSSPLTQKRSKSLRHGGKLSSTRVLEKSMSCRSLGELELEEVKGFMDLGFTFKKEHLSPRMMSIVPGLQRLGLFKSKDISNTTKLIINDDEVANKDDEILSRQEDEEMRGEIRRPYLSEAWLIKRPDSPLLNIKVPRVYAADDMKKHLRFWARTVASVIHQEC